MFQIMEYVILRILKEEGFYKPGDITTVSPLMAQRLIDDGVAERYVRKQHGNNTKDSSSSRTDLSG